MNIIFVCTGNTCRSPMAEGYAKKIMPGLTISSRGLSVFQNSRVSTQAVSVLEKENIDISEHIPKQLTNDDIDNSDLIITMTKSQSDYIKLLTPQNKDKILFLNQYTDFSDIADPYGRDYFAYEKCFNEIKNSLDILRLKINYE